MLRLVVIAVACTFLLIPVAAFSGSIITSIEPVGPRLASWPLYEPFTAENAASDFMPENGKLYAQSIPEVVAALGLREATPGHRAGPRP